MRQSNLGYEAEGKERSGHKQTLKGLNPVTYIVEEVDLVPKQGKRYMHIRLVRVCMLFRGRRPWHDTEWVYQELGRSDDFEPTDKEVNYMAQTAGELQTKL